MCGKCAKVARCVAFEGGCVSVDDEIVLSLDAQRRAINWNSTGREQNRKCRPYITQPMLHRTMTCAFAFVMVVSSVRPGSPPALAAAGTVPSVTDPRYFAGANVPWFNWGCDFGCSDQGVRSPAVYAALSDGFGRLQAAGVHTVRWWTFEGD